MSDGTTDKTALLAEAYRRGILPPDRAAAYEEAMRRGLVPKIEAATVAPAERKQSWLERFGIGGDRPDTPRWDYFGDTGRAAKEAVLSAAGEVASTLPGAQNKFAERQNQLLKQGDVGTAVSEDVTRAIDEHMRPFKIATDALGLLWSPVTGAIHSGVGSPLSYLWPGERPKASTDRAIDLAMMGAGLYGLARGGPLSSFGSTTEATPAAPRNALIDLQKKAADIVSRRAVADKLTAQGVLDAQAKAAETGDKITLMDLGKKNVQGLAGTVYRAPGDASSVIGDFLEGRTKEALPSITRDIQSSVGSGSTYQTGRALMNARSVTARPLWDAAMDKAVVWSPRLQDFFASPIIKSGLRAGLELEKQDAITEGRPFKAEDYAVDFNEAGDPVFKGVPTMRLLKVAKQVLDARLEGEDMRNPVTQRLTEKGRSLQRFRDAYIGEVDRLNPDYKVARDAWSGPTQSNDAMLSGRDHFSRAESNEQVADEFNKLSANDKEFYRIGAAEAKIDAAERGADAGDKSKRIINNERDRKRFRILFDSDDQAQKFIDSVDRKRTAFETKQSVTGGSQTAGRLAEDTADTDRAFSSLAHTASHAASGNILGTILSAMNARRHLGLINDPALNMEVAKLLVDPMIFRNQTAGVDFLRSVPLPGIQNYLARAAARFGAFNKDNALQTSPFVTQTAAPNQGQSQ